MNHESATVSEYMLDVDGDVLSYLIEGLSQGVEYYVRMSAINAVGTGAGAFPHLLGPIGEGPSIPTSLTPMAIPDAPPLVASLTPRLKFERELVPGIPLPV